MSYIYQQVNESAFHDAFNLMGRGDQYSYEGRKALYEYLNELAADQGAPIKFDVIALCCDFYEGTAEDVARDYRVTVGEGEDLEEAVREYLSNKTVLYAEYTVRDTVGSEKTCFLYQAF